MRALLVCAGLVFRSAWGTANTQPVPARDSVEATLTDEAAWWEHATSLIESTIRTYGGDRGLRVSTLAQESTSGEFVQAGSNPALIHTQEGGAVYTADVRQRLGVVAGPADPPASLTGSPGTGTIVRSGATLTGPHPLILSPMNPMIRDDRPPGRRISDEEAWSWLTANSVLAAGSTVRSVEPSSTTVEVGPITTAEVTSSDIPVRPDDGSAWQLTEAEMREVLTLAGWETSLHEQALFVSSCESRWSPEAIGDSGSARGLFQVHKVWADYIELPWIAALEPVANAQMALGAYQYSIAKGYEPWAQWAERCRP